MDWNKIIITVLVFYALVASFLVKKTKTMPACIILTLLLAVGSVFVFETMQTYQAVLEESIQSIISYVNDLYQ